MYRQYKRRIKRGWDKIPCFISGKERFSNFLDPEEIGKLLVRKYDCTERVNVSSLSNTGVVFRFKCCEDLLLEYSLDMFCRWRLFPIAVVDGFYFRGLRFNLGLASDEWLDMHFGDDEFVN